MLADFQACFSSRIGEMYEEIFNGYKINSELDISFTETADATIAKDIQFYSVCVNIICFRFSEGYT